MNKQRNKFKSKKNIYCQQLINTTTTTKRWRCEKLTLKKSMKEVKLTLKSVWVNITKVKYSSLTQTQTKSTNNI